MRMRWWWAALLGTWLGLGHVPAAAAEQRDVAAGRAAYQQGDFLGALSRLEAAARNPQLTEDDLVQLHWTLAACHHAMQQQDATTRELDAVLALRPLHEADPLETPPPLRALWEQRRAAWDAGHGVTLGEAHWDGGTLVVPLAGHVDDVADVLVHLRAPGEPVFRSAVIPALGTQARGTLLDAAFWVTLPPGGVEAVLEARTRRGVVVARAGHALSPLVLPVDEAQRTALVVALTPPPPVPPLPAPGVLPAPSSLSAPQPAPPQPAPNPVTAEPQRPMAAPDTSATHPSTAVMAATAWTAYAAAFVATGVLTIVVLTSLVVPPLAAVLAPAALLAAAGMATATWAVAQRFGRWRAPLSVLLAGGVAPTAACVLPISLLGGTCISAGVLLNPFTVNSVQNLDVRDLWLVYPITIGGCVCFSGPWVAALVVGMLGGAALTSFLATEFGRPMDADDNALHMDLLFVPEVDALEDGSTATP